MKPDDRTQFQIEDMLTTNYFDINRNNTEGNSANTLYKTL